MGLYPTQILKITKELRFILPQNEMAVSDGDNHVDNCRMIYNMFKRLPGSNSFMQGVRKPVHTSRTYENRVVSLEM